MQIGSTGATGAQGTAQPDRASLQKAAKQFEAIFLRQMIGSMRTASLGDGMLDSSATQQFRDMADSRTADSMADKGALGIAELLLGQFGGARALATPAAATAAAPTAEDKTA